MLLSPIGEHLVGRPETGGGVDDGRASYALALKDGEVSGRVELVSMVLVQGFERGRRVFLELARGDVRPCFEDHDPCAGARQLVRRHCTGLARADDHDIRFEVEARLGDLIGHRHVQCGKTLDRGFGRIRHGRHPFVASGMGALPRLAIPPASETGPW